jgi:uncharacterized phiE125 gp8 family phage protein
MSWLPAIVTVEPASEPVTLTEAKAQCRVDGSDSDTELNIYIKAARIFVEEYCGIKLAAQTVVLRCRHFCDFVDLPVAPLSAIADIKYLDIVGVEQTLDTAIYESVLVGLDPSIRLKINQTWPAIRCANDAIRVTASAGYSTVPEPIRAAIVLMVSAWFDNRTVGPAPEGATNLLSNYRRF